MEKEKLFQAIWKTANDLRGKTYSWDFKNYILGMLFYKYICEDLIYYINDDERKSGQNDFDYSLINDGDITDDVKNDIVNTKGYFIYPSETFNNVLKKAKNDEKSLNSLNETLNKVFDNIVSSAKGSYSYDNISGLFSEIDLNSNKLDDNLNSRNKKILQVMLNIAQIDLNYRDNKTDYLGDAYEYLISMYASSAGKSGGEFFTPVCVSQLLAKLVILKNQKIKKIYDPACGSGSLLLQVNKVLQDNLVEFYGQESENTTYNLCRMNMFLHNINYTRFNIKCGDTLESPKHDNIKNCFDVIVSNPPYSIKWKGKDDISLANDERFTCAGVLAPKDKADLAFVMHVLYCLSVTGTGAIVIFPGVLYRQNAEYKIRKYLCDENYIDSIIALPKNLFFGTTIDTCIMILKKNKQDNKILFIDASKEFIKEGKKNKLTDVNIDKILQVYSSKEDVKDFSKLVAFDEIVKNNYDLSVNNFVKIEDKRPTINIDELNLKISKSVVRQSELRQEIDKIIKELENI